MICDLTYAEGGIVKCHSEQGSDSDASEESRRRTAYTNSKIIAFRRRNYLQKFKNRIKRQIHFFGTKQQKLALQQNFW